MRIFSGKDYTYRMRKTFKRSKVSAEYLQLANSLKSLVDNEGQDIYFDQNRLIEFADSANGITEMHIRMIMTIRPQIKLICDTSRFIEDETAIEQMYHALLTAGYSRNVISGFLYAVFFSLNKELKLSRLETEKLKGCDVFSYQKDKEILVNNSNIGIVEDLIKQSNQNAMVELGRQIFNGNIEKYKYNDTYAANLCKEALNRGSGKAAQVLGDHYLTKANARLVSNDDYSKAYEYYTAYGATTNSEYLAKSHQGIVDILNLGLYNHKMILNYFVIALIFSISFFIPFLLNYLGFHVILSMSIKNCIIFSAMEFMAAISGAVVRYVRPFFTQGWIVFLQSVLWLIGLIIMVT